MPPAPKPSAIPAPQKSRLGRGLSSLIKVSIPDDAGASPPARHPAPPAAPTVVANAPATVVEKLVEKRVEVPSGEAILVPIHLIRPNPHQPRKQFTEQSLRELADSIKSNGIIQPLVIRANDPSTGGGGVQSEPQSYELIAGERRLRAAKLAGLTEVPCHIKRVDALTQAQLALVENIQREDLNPIDRAEGYKTLLTQLGLTQSELAVRLGEDRSTIANYTRLLDLVEPVRKLVRDGTLSLGHAKLLAGVTDVLEQESLAKLVLSQGLSVRNLEKLILNARSGGGVEAPKSPAADANVGKEAHYQELEKSISRKLGMRVQLKSARGKGKGKLTIHYSSLDQFDHLMDKLGVEVE